jgi:type I restriction enzyme S subunit
MSTKHLCVLSFDRTKIEPVYVWAALLFDPELVAQVRASGHGAIMEGWNTTIVKRLKLRVPPLDLQRDFVRRVKSVQKLEAEAERSGAKLAILLQTLTHRAFSGELTSRWAASHADKLAYEAEEQVRALHTKHGEPYRRAALC